MKQNLKMQKIISLHNVENENTKGVVKQPFDKGISMDVKYGLNQLSQQRLGIEMGLYQQKHCQLGLKEIENEAK